MSRTKVVIGYLQSLLMLEDPELEQFITQSECAYYFSLSWLITWYGHVVRSHEEAYRLIDLFLASHPLMSVYLAAAVSDVCTHTHTNTILTPAYVMFFITRPPPSRSHTLTDCPLPTFRCPLFRLWDECSTWSTLKTARWLELWTSHCHGNQTAWEAPSQEFG